MADVNVPQAATVLNDCIYPSWWSGATTIMVKTTVDGDAVFAVADVELYPYGVATPTGGLEGSTETWSACIHPWDVVQTVVQYS